MKCLNYITIRGERTTVVIPCGRCLVCLKNRQESWITRLKHEFDYAQSAHFLTLTYDELQITYEPISKKPNLAKKHLQDFIKRIREAQRRYIITRNEKIAPTGLKEAKIKYYAVGEYGSTTSRPHYHIIIFNLEPAIILKINTYWTQGFIQVGTVTDNSIHYVTKYVLTDPRILDKNLQKPFALMSKGMGADYLTDNKQWHTKTKRFYTMDNGFKKKIPRYYKDKLFSGYDKAINTKKQQIVSDKNYLKEKERVERLGNDFIKYSDEHIQNFVNSINKSLNKNSKL